MDATVIYKGPPGQQVPLLAAHGHAGACKPGDTYTVPTEIAERLVRSSRWFRHVRTGEAAIPAESTAAAAAGAVDVEASPRRRHSRKAVTTAQAPDRPPEAPPGDEEDTEQ